MIKYRVFDIIQNKYIDSNDVSIAGDGTLTVIGNIHENPDLLSARDKNVPSKKG